jgi:hypothetical protein
MGIFLYIIYVRYVIQYMKLIYIYITSHQTVSCIIYLYIYDLLNYSDYFVSNFMMISK